MEGILVGDAILFSARVLISLFFCISAIGAILHWSDEEQRLQNQYKLPAPKVLMAVAVGIQLLAGLMLLVGWHSRLAAMVLFLYLLVSTVMIHKFWQSAPETKHYEQMHFCKNMALLGCMLLFLGYGAGPMSIDWYCVGGDTGIPTSRPPSSPTDASHANDPSKPNSSVSPVNSATATDATKPETSPTSSTSSTH